MKKIITLILSLAMVMALLACGKQEAQPQKDAVPTGYDTLQASARLKSNPRILRFI